MSCLVNLLECIHVFNSRRHLVCHIVCDALDRASQNLATARLWQSVHEDDTVELGESTNILTHLLVDHFLELHKLGLAHVLRTSAFQDNVSEGALATNLVIVGDDGTFDDIGMLVDNLFEAACRDTMASCVNHIINARHNVHVSL